MSKQKLRSIITLVLVVTLVIPFFTTTVSAEYENTYSNTGNMRDDIIGVALTQVGYTEGSNNYTKYGVWYGMPNSPWCGMFVSWCANQAGIPTSVLKRTGIANPSNFGLSYQSGSDYTPIKGDLFFKKGFSHVGLVYYTEGDYFYTVEGNTSTTTYDGTSVMIRKRKISDFYFSSPNYSGSSNTGCTHDYEVKVEADHPHKEFKVCSKCSNKTYTGNKIADSNCKTCIQEACSHTFGTWTSAGDSKHKRVCSKCEYEETNSHNWEEGNIIAEPTCVKEGSRQVTCKDCGAETSKSIPATGEHTYTDFSYIDEANHQKVCSMCEEQTLSAHNLSSEWQSDNLYHWTSCVDCSGRICHAEHNFSNGCLNPCDDCGFVSTSGHKGNGELVSDGTHHWEICIRCGQKTNVSQHDFSSNCDADCNTCGYERANHAPHKDEYCADETGHWTTCTACQRVTEVTSHSPDQNAKDWETLTCVHCAYELRSSDKHVHTFATVEYDAHNHWGTCECGETMEAEVHSWNMKTGRCDVCGAKNVPIEDTQSDNMFVKLWKQIWKK